MSIERGARQPERSPSEGEKTEKEASRSALERLKGLLDKYPNTATLVLAAAVHAGVLGYSYAKKGGNRPVPEDVRTPEHRFAEMAPEEKSAGKRTPEETATNPQNEEGVDTPEKATARTDKKPDALPKPEDKAAKDGAPSENRPPDPDGDERPKPSDANESDAKDGPKAETTSSAPVSESPPKDAADTSKKDASKPTIDDVLDQMESQQKGKEGSIDAKALKDALEGVDAETAKQLLEMAREASEKKGARTADAETVKRVAELLKHADPETKQRALEKMRRALDEAEGTTDGETPEKAKQEALASLLEDLANEDGSARGPEQAPGKDDGSKTSPPEDGQAKKGRSDAEADAEGTDAFDPTDVERHGPMIIETKRLSAKRIRFAESIADNPANVSWPDAPNQIRLVGRDRVSSFIPLFLNELDDIDPAFIKEASAKSVSGKRPGFVMNAKDFTAENVEAMGGEVSLVVVESGTVSLEAAKQLKERNGGDSKKMTFRLSEGAAFEPGALKAMIGTLDSFTVNEGATLSAKDFEGISPEEAKKLFLFSLHESTLTPEVAAALGSFRSIFVYDSLGSRGGSFGPDVAKAFPSNLNLYLGNADTFSLEALENLNVESLSFEEGTVDLERAKRLKVRMLFVGVEMKITDEARAVLKQNGVRILGER